jgi:hypothetical protein
MTAEAWFRRVCDESLRAGGLIGMNEALSFYLTEDDGAFDPRGGW